MRLIMMSLMRLTFSSLLGLTGIALGLGQMIPRERAWRSPSVVSHVSLNSLYFTANDTDSRWLDRKTGQVTKLGLPEGEIMEFGSCSPWRDESGEHQVTGRWSRRLGRNLQRVQEDSGIVRVRFPSGEVLDRIPTDIIPIGIPCWYRAPEARMLFAAGDGSLHQLSFDAPEGERIPTPITWEVKPPGLGSINISDPAWIDDGSTNPCLVVCLRLIHVESNRRVYSPAELWWLRLNANGNVVVAAGRLLNPPAEFPKTETRCPTVMRNPDGSYRLAYCRRIPGRKWEMRVATVDQNPKDHAFAASNEGRLLFDSCLPTPASFSQDGRWISGMRGEFLKKHELVRVPVDAERGGLAAVDSLTIRVP